MSDLQANKQLSGDILSSSSPHIEIPLGGTSTDNANSSTIANDL